MYEMEGVFFKGKFDLKKKADPLETHLGLFNNTHTHKKVKKTTLNYYHRQPFVALPFYRFIYGNFKTIGLRSRHGRMKNVCILQ